MYINRHTHARIHAYMHARTDIFDTHAGTYGQIKHIRL